MKTTKKAKKTNRATDHPSPGGTVHHVSSILKIGGDVDFSLRRHELPGNRHHRRRRPTSDQCGSDNYFLGRLLEPDLSGAEQRAPSLSMTARFPAL